MRRFKDNRDNRDNFFPRLQAGTGRRNGLSLLSLLSFKKNKRAKNNPLVLLFIFCFLHFLYNRLFPIILVFSNCILYIGFSQLDWFFPIVFYILAFPNYIVFFPQLYCIFTQLSLFSSCKLSYEEDGTCGAFLYDVDKGAGGVKLYMLWLFRGQRHGHDGCCHGCSLGALLVNLDLCLLKHVRDVHGG